MSAPPTPNTPWAKKRAKAIVNRENWNKRMKSVSEYEHSSFASESDRVVRKSERVEEKKEKDKKEKNEKEKREKEEKEKREREENEKREREEKEIEKKVSKLRLEKEAEESAKKMKLEEKREKEEKKRKEDEMKERESYAIKIENLQKIGGKYQSEWKKSEQKAANLEKKLKFVRKTVEKLKKNCRNRTVMLKKLNSDKRKLLQQVHSLMKKINDFHPNNVSPYSSLQNRDSKRNRREKVVQYLKFVSCEENFSYLLKDILKHLSRDPDSCCKFILSPDQALLFKSQLNLSLGQLDNMKLFLKREIGFDFLPSREIVHALEKGVLDLQEYSFSKHERVKILNDKLRCGDDTQTTEKLKIVSVQCENIPKLLATSLKDLSDSNQLILGGEFENKIWLGVTGDKGAGVTKLNGIIANVRHCNSVFNQIPLGFYDGDDSCSNVREFLPNVVKQLNELIEVTFSHKNQLVTVEVEQFLCGDNKFLSEMCDHKGAASEFFCMLCMRKNNRGKKLIDLENWNFELKSELRTLETYSRDSKSEMNGVRKGLGPVFTQIKMSNFVPAQLHIFMGILQKYIIDNLDRIVWVFDNVTDFRFEDLTSKKSILRKVDKDITDYKTDLKIDEKDLNTLNCVITAFQNIQAMRIVPTKTKENLCACNAACLYRDKAMDKSKDKKLSWVKCTHCSQFFHYNCAGVWTQMHREAFEARDLWQCLNCRGVHLKDREYEAAKCRSELENIVNKEKENLEKMKKEAETVRKILDGTVGKYRTTLENAWNAVGVDRAAYFQNFNGNQSRVLLSQKGIEATFSVFKNVMSPELENLKYLMTCMGNVQNFTIADWINPADMPKYFEATKKLAEAAKTACPRESVTQKFHIIIEHAPDFARMHKTLGLLTEQGTEAFHAAFNRKQRRVCSTRSQEDRYRLILRDSLLNTKLFHSGLLKPRK